MERSTSVGEEAESSVKNGPALVRVPVRDLAERVDRALRAAGASEESAAAAVRALMHASRHGIDSHGVRLTEHYCRMLGSGRINPKPRLKVDRRAAGSAMIDGDDGLGHYAAYRAMDLACELAREAGVAGVGIVRSSHLGAAGAYACAGAEAGCFAFATTNANSSVGVHDGSAAFHGTNPLAFAAPVPGERPWLLDMATSSIPMNRVFLSRTLGRALPAGAAADSAGAPTTDPHAAQMLLPLGGVDFGYKGAGLAGLATLLSAAMTGAALDPDMIPMFNTENIRTPRNVGAFVLALDAERFAGAAAFGAAIQSYLRALRASPSREGGGPVMAPGDREWREAERRDADGVPIDPATAAFLGF